MTASQLHFEAWSYLGLGTAKAAIHLADADYRAPRLAWVLEDYAGWYRRSLTALGLADWREERHDCDDFAGLYAALAKICHARTPGAGRTALPVGTLWYRTTAGGHAINLVSTSDAGLVAIEPQAPGAVLTLSAEEKASAWLAVF